MCGTSPTAFSAYSRYKARSAAVEAVAGYGFSFIFATVGEAYAMLFALAGLAFLVALATDLLVPATGTKGSRA